MKQLHALLDARGELHSSSGEGRVAWWSFTKTLIAALALRLCERRILALEEPLGEHPFTLRQTLQHRSGLPDYGGLAGYHEAVAASDRPWSDQELLERAAADRLLFQPGSGWRYSNIGYLLARRLMEARTATPLGPLLESEILRPLGIEKAVFATTAEEMAALALPPPHPYDPGWVFHGLVLGSAAEAALSLHRLLEEPLLSPNSKAVLQERYAIGGAVPGRPWLIHGYGLGTMIGTAGDTRRPAHFVGHSAGGPGSCGAVYRIVLPSGGVSTAAVFDDSGSEADAEFVVLELARSIESGR